MKLPDSFVVAWEPKMLSLLRIVAGFMFMLHGTQKHLGFPVPRAGTVDVLSLPGIAGMMEIVGGALLIIGLFALAGVTRLVPGAARYDVNLVFRVWPGFEPVFPHLVPFLMFVAVMIVIATYVIGRALGQLARGEVSSRSWARSRPSSRTT